jgi:3-deoxy-alpha-D-manno-octulosonate 8-oxidase
MTIHKNFNGIEKTVFGRGSFSQLGEIVEGQRNQNDAS